jgi:hypothetical protein
MSRQLNKLKLNKLKLNKLSITCFKGIQHYELNLDGGNAVIAAANGVGKTTIYDAFLWLLFGKDSSGRKDFEVRPLDRRNQPVKGLVLAVESELEIDGITHVFRKEHHEKVVKDQLRGYETQCWIDEVPKKVGEYAEYIADIISEETFKLLTDLHFFNSKFHHTDRRKVLLAVAGEIGTPKGFEALTDSLNGRTMKDYKNVLSEQKKRHAKERDEINPRIDEICKGVEHPNINVVDLEYRRATLTTEIQQLKIKRQGLTDSEQDRQKKINEKNLLIVEQRKREVDLTKLDPEKTAALRAGREQLHEEIRISENYVRVAEKALEEAKAEKELAESTMQIKLRNRESVFAEFKQIEGEKEGKENNVACPKCSFEFDPKESEKKARKEKRLALITEQGISLKEEIGDLNETIFGLARHIKNLQMELERKKEVEKTVLQKAEERINQIDKQIADAPTPMPQEDERWLELDHQIQVIDKEIGPGVAEQLETIEQERIAKDTELEGLNKELAQADRITKDRARIQELEAKEKELAQAIADLEKQLAEIDRYDKTVSTMITSVVNGKFTAVEFKLFKELLNGGLEPCCEATYRGVPYADMSSGQKIFCGIDIINVLSEHYGVSVPLFIDHSESMTLPIEAHSQTIELKAEKGVKQLQVQTKTSTKERQVA